MTENKPTTELKVRNNIFVQEESGVIELTTWNGQLPFTLSFVPPAGDASKGTLTIARPAGGIKYWKNSRPGTPKSYKYYDAQKTEISFSAEDFDTLVKLYNGNDTINLTDKGIAELRAKAEAQPPAVPTARGPNSKLAL